MRYIGSTLFVIALAFHSFPANSADWVELRDRDFGFTYQVPANTFVPAGEDKPSTYGFKSRNGDAKLMFSAWNNKEGRSPDGFKRWLLTNAEGYDELTYRPRGRSWFVLSGYRGDSIYYEKVMFSCGGQVVNVFAISYPVKRRDRYDQIVERIEDHFRPGNGC
jgi:hypothetical protein